MNHRNISYGIANNHDDESDHSKDHDVCHRSGGPLHLHASSSAVEMTSTSERNSTTRNNHQTIERLVTKRRGNDEDGSSQQRAASSNSNPYTSWRRDDDEADIMTNTTNTRNSGGGTCEADDAAWQILIKLLKAWFIIWLLFAGMIVIAELASSSHNRENFKILDSDAVEHDTQTYLAISEQVVQTCSYSNLETKEGRGECQILCRGHMCCFEDDDNNIQHDTYQCKDNPKKVCAVYAGCESLVVAEEDVYDVFEYIESKENTMSTMTIDANTSSVPSDQESVELKPQPTQPTQHEHAESAMHKNNYTDPRESTTITDLGLISQVITTVCANDNLHKRHGIQECAALCNPSMCCFDRDELKALNPHMDVILKLEGVGNDILDRTAMGTCLDEEEVASTIQSASHFCKVHSGCKSLLLFGSSVHTFNKRNPSAVDPLLHTSMGIHDEDNGANDDNRALEKQQAIVVLVSFFGLVGITVYMLVFKRISSSSVTTELSRIRNDRFNEEDEIEFI